MASARKPWRAFAVRKKLVGLRVAQSRGFERNHDLAVEAVLAEEATLGRRENAYDGIFAAVDEQGPAETVAGGKQGLGNTRAEKRHTLPSARLFGRIDAALLQFSRRHFIKVGRGAGDEEVVGLVTRNLGDGNAPGKREDEQADSPHHRAIAQRISDSRHTRGEWVSV